MKKDIPTLLEIKMMVRHETSGSKIMPRFYDFMENNDEYMMNLDPCTDENVPDMIGQLVCKALQIKHKSMQFDKAIFLENRADHFFHGQFFTSGHLVSFFYFDDLKIGCMAIAASFGKQTMYMRFDGDFLRDRLN